MRTSSIHLFICLFFLFILTLYVTNIKEGAKGSKSKPAKANAKKNAKSKAKKKPANAQTDHNTGVCSGKTKYGAKICNSDPRCLWDKMKKFCIKP